MRLTFILTVLLALTGASASFAASGSATSEDATATDGHSTAFPTGCSTGGR